MAVRHVRADRQAVRQGRRRLRGASPPEHLRPLTRRARPGSPHRRERRWGLLFPGASGPDELWDLLRDGVDATGATPPTRYGADSPHAPGTLATRRNGYVDALTSTYFDVFAGISPATALRTPRLLELLGPREPGVSPAPAAPVDR
ncbi:beta-ketoacyl synthase N-terminal-like domain-containing protein [Saccharopolyspora sp. NPDC000359]|uniref:beta-ketoacyl synthase N-terminal-like domain-containing protein n=1 Tax=Saccharopolyspora sp. NPDC000359 TaxID=3154251 RepID=UPI00331EF5B7